MRPNPEPDPVTMATLSRSLISHPSAVVAR
jgi:hypothetical protein